MSYTQSVLTRWKAEDVQKAEVEKAIRELRQSAAEAADYLLDLDRVSAQVHGKRLLDALVVLSKAKGTQP